MMAGFESKSWINAVPELKENRIMKLALMKLAFWADPLPGRSAGSLPADLDPKIARINHTVVGFTFSDIQDGK
jgi:hypothetical protein